VNDPPSSSRTILDVGALLGPGILLVPSPAADAAGPASIIAWAALLVFSAPLAISFAALGVRHLVAGGVAAYVEARFGGTASVVTGVWFLTVIAVEELEAIQRLMRER
jgi:amino acid efflux transporter